MIPATRGAVSLRHRPQALAATALARLLVQLPPCHLRSVLSLIRHGAAPATAEKTLTAREEVVAVSARCSGEGCLQRSVATALLCRMHGLWPDWCAGVRTAPFRAHAWVEVDGQPIGEPHPAGYYRRLMTVPSRPRSTFEHRKPRKPAR